MAACEFTGVQKDSTLLQKFAAAADGNPCRKSLATPGNARHPVRLKAAISTVHFLSSANLQSIQSP